MCLKKKRKEEEGNPGNTNLNKSNCEAMLLGKSSLCLAYVVKNVDQVKTSIPQVFHQIGTDSIQKTILFCNDEARYVLEKLTDVKIRPIAYQVFKTMLHTWHSLQQRRKKRRG